MPKKINPRDFQDKIFKRMTADQRVALGSQLWRFAKDIVGEKIDFRKSGSKTSTHKSRENGQAPSGIQNN